MRWLNNFKVARVLDYDVIFLVVIACRAPNVVPYIVCVSPSERIQEPRRHGHGTGKFLAQKHTNFSFNNLSMRILPEITKPTMVVQHVSHV